MCSRVQCRTCGRPTYAGCGQHVEQVLGDVAPADRCQGHQAPKRAAGEGSGFLQRILGR